MYHFRSNQVTEKVFLTLDVSFLTRYVTLFGHQVDEDNNYPGYRLLDRRMSHELGDWDLMTVRRDYGVGRKQRYSRGLSRDPLIT